MKSNGKIVKIILQENYDEELEVPIRISSKAREIPEFIMREIPIELLTTNLLKQFSRFKMFYKFLKII